MLGTEIFIDKGEKVFFPYFLIPFTKIYVKMVGKEGEKSALDHD